MYFGHETVLKRLSAGRAIQNGCWKKMYAGLPEGDKIIWSCKTRWEPDLQFSIPLKNWAKAFNKVSKVSLNTGI